MARKIDWTAGDVLTAAQMLALQNSVWQDDVNAQVASYTLVLTDQGKQVTMTVVGANTLTVPPNASVAFVIGTRIFIYMMGAGVTTLTAGAGVTLSSAPSLAMAQYQVATLTKTATNVWAVSLSAGASVAATNFSSDQNILATQVFG